MSQRSAGRPCPACGRALKVGGRVGRAVRCSRCKTILVVGEGGTLSIRDPGGEPTRADPEAETTRVDRPDAESDTRRMGRVRIEETPGPGAAGGEEAFAGHDILGELGRGGMGTVYKARHRRTGQVVALKVLQGGDEASRIAVRRFEREIRIVSQLDHANVVRILDDGVEGGYHWFTMDLVRGPTFRDYLSPGRSDPKRVASFFGRVLDALAHAHRKGVVHRDLKPSNLLITSDGEPILTDFGLARQLDSESQLTKTDSAIGTPFYMAPEQLSGERDAVGPRSDLYAIGVMLYETLAGRLPFEAETSAQLFKKILTEEPPAPSRLADGVDRQLEAVCLKAIRRDPAARFSSAREFADDLERYVSGERVQTRPPSSVRRSLRQVRRHPGAAVAVGLAILAAAVAIGLRLGRDRTEPAAAGGPAAARLRAESEHRAGAQALEAGRIDEAIERFRAAIEADPDLTDGHLDLARALADGGRLEEADAALAGLLLRQPTSREALLGRGRLALERGQARQALLHLEALYALDAEDVEACRGLARTHEALGDRMAAEFYVKKADEILAVRSSRAVESARAALAGGDVVGALATLEPYLGIEPPLAPVHALHAETLEGQGNLTRALAALGRAIESDPTSAAHRVGRARILVALGRHEAAAADLDRLPEAAAGGEATYLRARIAAVRGHHFLALTSFDEVLDGTFGRDPERRLDIRYRRAVVRLALDDPDGALVDLEAVLDARPDDLGARYRRGVALVALGRRLDEAEADLRMALEGGRLEEVEIELARLALADRRPGEALAHLESAERRGPSAEIHHLRARALLDLGRPRDALGAVDEALRLDAQRARHYSLRGRIQGELGDYAAAEASYRRTIELDVNDFDALVGLFESLVGQNGFVRVLTLNSFLNDSLNRFLETPVDLLDPDEEELRSRFLEGRAAVDESVASPGPALVDEYCWAVGQSDPAVRAAGLEGLAACGPAMLDEVADRLSLAGRRDLETAIAVASARRLRQAVLPVLAAAHLTQEPEIVDRWLRERGDGLATLVEMLLDDGEDPAARRLAARALASVRSLDAHAALRRLVDAEDVRTRALAAGALAEARFAVDPAVFERLVVEPDPLVRGLAVQRMAVSRHHVPAVLAAALEDADERVRLHAARRLAFDRSPERRRAVAVLRQGLASGDARARRLAVRALASLEDEGLVEDLTARLDDPDPLVRRDVASIFCDFESRAACPALVRRLRIETRRDVRAQIVLSLADIRYAEARDLLEPILLDESAPTIERGIAFYYFIDTKIIDARLGLALLRLTRSSEDWRARSFTLVGIGFVSGQFSGLLRPVLLPALDDEDPRIRASAAVAVANIPGDDVGQRIRTLVEDPHDLVREAAAGSLVRRVVTGIDEPRPLEDELAGGGEAARSGAARAWAEPPEPELDADDDPLPLTPEALAGWAERLERSIALDPTEPEWPRRAVGVLSRLDRLDEAVALADRSLAIWPEDEQLLFLRGETELRRGGADGKARQDLEAFRRFALRADPVWPLLAEARSRTGDPDGAAEAHGAAWVADPADHRRLRPMAEACLATGRASVLLAALEDAVRRWPEDPAGHWFRARALAVLGRRDDALWALGRAIEYGQPAAGEASEFDDLRGEPGFEALFR